MSEHNQILLINYKYLFARSFVIYKPKGRKEKKKREKKKKILIYFIYRTSIIIMCMYN